jgi:hypothetical protein
MTVKNAVSWDAKPHGFCKDRRFRKTCLIHHQGRKIQRARISSLIPVPRWWMPCSPKRRFLHKPHGVTSQKTAFFNITIGSQWRKSTWIAVVLKRHRPCSWEGGLKTEDCIIALFCRPVPGGSGSDGVENKARKEVGIWPEVTRSKSGGTGEGERGLTTSLEQQSNTFQSRPTEVITWYHRKDLAFPFSAAEASTWDIAATAWLRDSNWVP